MPNDRENKRERENLPELVCFQIWLVVDLLLF